MTPESSEISAEDWPAVKTLWFAVQDAEGNAQLALLSDPSVSTKVRMHVTRMLDAATRVGERFEKPAMLSLGMTAVVEAPQPTLIGQRLGAYEVVRRVGQGGMGAVYEAVRADDVYRNRVAIKTIWRGADSEVLLQRFRSERQILASLQHPNIAGLIDGGATAQGMPWLAMEYVDGIAIDQYCDKHQLGLPARLDLFRQVCTAVQYAHSRLVIHRDLKPSNVLVTTDGTVKLLDFGVSKLLDDTEDGTLTGAGLSPFTAAYAAPEQVVGGAISTTTDVYALGALLVTLLSGEPPVNVDDLSPAARVEMIRNATPRAPSMIVRRAITGDAADRGNDANTSGVKKQKTLAVDVSLADKPHVARGYANERQLENALRGELDAIALMALRREPERRYGSAQALSDDVHRYLKRERVHARPDTLSYRIRSTVRRQPALVASATIALVAVVGGSMFALNQARAMRAEAARSERVGAFMAGMVAGPSSNTNDPVIRIGPQGTVADLLDSALVRVPSEFADDIRMRARLYTAIGVNYSGQARFRAAMFVLDSATQLARAGYGEHSAEYARALLEFGELQLALKGPAGVDSVQKIIDRTVVGSAVDTGGIRSNRLSLIAERAIAAGEIRVADSVATIVSREEAVRGQRTMASARADVVLIKTSSWLRRDPREYVQRCRALIQSTEEMGALLTTENAFAAGCLVHGLVTLGRNEEAQRVLDAHVPRFEQNFGKIPLFAATLHAERSEVSAALGDSVKRREAVTRAWDIVGSLPDVSLADRQAIGMSFIEDAWSRNGNDDALKVSNFLVKAMESSGGMLYRVYSALYLGISRYRVNDFSGAERALRDGIALLPKSHDLDSMLPRLRRVLTLAVRGQNRNHEADSLSALDPLPAAVPPCTPGGDWKGCPDIKK